MLSNNHGAVLECAEFLEPSSKSASTLRLVSPFWSTVVQEIQGWSISATESDKCFVHVSTSLGQSERAEVSIDLREAKHYHQAHSYISSIIKRLEAQGVCLDLKISFSILSVLEGQPPFPASSRLCITVTPECSLCDDDLPRFLPLFPNLAGVDLHNSSRITNKGLKYVVDAVNAPLTQDGTPRAEGAPANGLRYLNISSNKSIDDDGIAIACSMQSLEILHLKHCTGMTDEALKFVGRLPELTELVLDGCEQLTDQALFNLVNPE